MTEEMRQNDFLKDHFKEKEFFTTPMRQEVAERLMCL